MGFFNDPYEYGEDEDTDKRLRRILRIEPNFLENYYQEHFRYPSQESINQRYAQLSARGNFYLLNDSREELDIENEKRQRRYQQNSSSDIGFWGAVGGLLGLVGGLMFEENPEYDEGEYYYEDEDDY